MSTSGDEKTIIEVHVEATKLAMHRGQVVGEKSEYYITLGQLEHLLRSTLQKPDSPV